MVGTILVADTLLVALNPADCEESEVKGDSFLDLNLDHGLVVGYTPRTSYLGLPSQSLS